MASRRMDTIKRAIDYYEKKESYDDAIKLLEKELNDPKDYLWLEERCELLERLAIFYHYISEDGDRARELEAITECIRLQKEEVKFKLNLSLKILGDGLLLIGDLGPASDYLHMGLARATDPNIRDLFYDSIAKVEAETKAKQDAEAASREKLRKELIEDEEKQKREIKDKMLEVKKQESTSSMEESTKEVEELVSELEIDESVKADNPPIPMWQPREFSAPFKVALTEKVGTKCYIGSLESSSALLEKSFIEASPHHINQLPDLISLGRRHESLLNVEHSVVDPTDGSKLLVTEVVCPLDEFFHFEYKQFTSPDKDFAAWWVHISRGFWRIFRDVTRGLMFLYEKTDLACGDLHFNCFVTVEGRGRILPTLEHDRSKEGEDVKELLRLIKRVLYIPSNGKPDDALRLPSDLTKLLAIIPRYLNLPASFLVDLPIFLTDGERIDFSLKFKKLVKKQKPNYVGVNFGMQSNGSFNKWWEVLDGVYYQIYDKSLSKKGNVFPYKNRVDIVRFFNDSYGRVNDYSYKIYRKKKKFTEKEIERDLVSYFPDYYVTIFECLCLSVDQTMLEVEELKELSSIYFRGDDL